MNAKKILYIFLYFLALFVPSLIFVSYGLIRGNTNGLYLLSGALGTTAYSILSIQFLLVSRPKFLEKIFGLQKIYKFHMMISLFALMFGYIHSQLKEDLGFSDSFQTTLGSISLVTFASAALFGIIFMANKNHFNINFINTLRTYITKFLNFKYKTKLFLHNITVLALIILLVHALLASSVEYNQFLMATLSIYFIVPLSLYFNRKRQSILKFFKLIKGEH